MITVTLTAGLATLEQAEKALLEATIQVFNNDKKKVAKALDIAPKTLYNKLHRHGLFVGRQRKNRHE